MPAIYGPDISVIYKTKICHENLTLLAAIPKRAFFLETHSKINYVQMIIVDESQIFISGDIFVLYITLISGP
jgi:hypothetical protein